MKTRIAVAVAVAAAVLLAAAPAGAAPANDNFADAAALPASTGTVDLATATTEPNEPGLASSDAGSVWYALAPAVPRTVRVEVTSTSTDPNAAFRAALFSGTTLETLGGETGTPQTGGTARKSFAADEPIRVSLSGNVTAAMTAETRPDPSSTIATTTDIADTSATLNGMVALNGATSVTYQFRVVRNSTGDEFVFPAAPSPVPADGAVTENASGLATGAQYQVTLVVRADTADPDWAREFQTGADTFIATSTAPTITAGSVTLGSSHASISATANHHASDGSSTVSVEYGPTTTYGTTQDVTQVFGSSDTPVVAQLADLTPGQTIHYRLSITRLGQTVMTDDATLTTQVAVTDVVSRIATFGRQIDVSAGVGVANQISVTEKPGTNFFDTRVTIVDTAAQLYVDGTGCAATGPHTAVCEISFVGFDVRVVGRDGNDVVSSLANNETQRSGVSVDGGTGADDIEGRSGDAFGSPIFSTISGGPGADTLKAQDFATTISYADHAEPVSVNLKQLGQSVQGGSEDGLPGARDTILSGNSASGGDAGDTLVASDGGSLLRGGPGDDTLTGGGFIDGLFGEGGFDTISARGGGSDSVNCGTAGPSEGGNAFADATDSVSGCDTTHRGAPLVVTGDPDDVRSTRAVLTGSVDPRSQTPTYFFEYGLSTAYGEVVPVTPVALNNSGEGAVEVSRILSGLEPAHALPLPPRGHERRGRTNGPDRTLTTRLPPGAPTAHTESASAISATGATLNGSVNPNGDATTFKFELGTTTAYGTTLPAGGASVGSDRDEHALSIPAGAHYRPDLSLPHSGDQWRRDDKWRRPHVCRR